MRRFRLSSGKSYIAGVFIFKQFQLYLQKTSVARHLFPPLLCKIQYACFACTNYLSLKSNSSFQISEKKMCVGGGPNVYINIYYGKYKYLFQKIIMMNQILCSFPLLKYIIRQIMYIHVYVANKNKQYTVYVIYYRPQLRGLQFCYACSCVDIAQILCIGHIPDCIILENCIFL